MIGVTREACRLSRGLVLWVCAGVTRKHCYWPGPEGLLYRWWADGGQCWRPVYWKRQGIPGSGGKQWLRADVEYVLAFKARPGPIHWADNTAMGHAPKYGPGGAMSNRLSSGQRVNQWGKMGLGGRRKNGKAKSEESYRTAHHIVTMRGERAGERQSYIPPARCNPGTLIETKNGGGHLGDREAHENEAPYSESLAEFFVRSFCPPGGVVLDPFSGSGTTAVTAVKHGRHGIGFDLRESQQAIGMRRMRRRIAEGRAG
jgi:hypothetical protein